MRRRTVNAPQSVSNGTTDLFDALLAAPSVFIASARGLEAGARP